MWVFALEWAYTLRKLDWLSKWGFGWSISGHLSVCPGPHSPVKLKSESQPRLPQNLPWIESTGNLSGATVIEINWILEIITLMLMWVLRSDNSPGDKYLREVGWETLLSQLERLGILVGWVGCCCGKGVRWGTWSYKEDGRLQRSKRGVKWGQGWGRGEKKSFFG